MNKKILVTGATGFIGYNIVNALIEKGYDVRILVRKATDRFEQKKVEIVYGDLLNPESLVKATKDIDTIIHAGGILGKFTTTEKQLRQIHIEGTENLLKVAKKNNVKRFIHISSIAVTGTVNSIGNEKTTLNPKTPYEKAKHDAEMLVKEFCIKEKINYTVIRPGSAYGIYETQEKAKMFQLIQKQRFFIIGNGKNLRSYVYVGNLVQGILLTLNNEKAINNIYIISDKRPYEMNELIYIIAEQLSVKRLIHIPKSIAYIIAVLMEIMSLITKKEPLLSRKRINTLTSQSYFTIEKAQDELGYNPEIDLSEGIKRTIEWYKKENILT